MNDRDRLLAIMDRQPPDRIPWIPRLQLWYEAQRRRGTLPPRYRGLSLREIEADLGLAAPARNGRVYRKELHDVEVTVRRAGADTITEYHTPLGTVSSTVRTSSVLEDAGIEGLEVAKPIKGPDDYAAVEYIVQHTEYVPAYDEYLAYEAEIGAAGYPMVQIDADPFFRILREYIGFDHAYYHLADYPEKVAHLLGVLEESAAAMQRVVLDSPARLILAGFHFHSQMTPPRLFRRYMLPYFRAFADRLHERGKLLACHADADTSRLLDLIVASGFDMAECFVTSPMAPVTLAQARAAFGSRVIIWGGIPSVILGDPWSDDGFEAYMRDIFAAIAPGDAFILGVSDNVMPESKIERVAHVTEMVEQWGGYPVQPLPRR